jgi:hypothetical protein
VRGRIPPLRSTGVSLPVSPAFGAASPAPVASIGHGKHDDHPSPVHETLHLGTGARAGVQPARFCMLQAGALWRASPASTPSMACVSGTRLGRSDRGISKDCASTSLHERPSRRRAAAIGRWAMRARPSMSSGAPFHPSRLIGRPAAHFTRYDEAGRERLSSSRRTAAVVASLRAVRGRAAKAARSRGSAPFERTRRTYATRGSGAIHVSSSDDRAEEPSSSGTSRRPSFDDEALGLENPARGRPRRARVGKGSFARSHDLVGRPGRPSPRRTSRPDPSWSPDRADQGFLLIARRRRRRSPRPSPSSSLSILRSGARQTPPAGLPSR